MLVQPSAVVVVVSPSAADVVVGPENSARSSTTGPVVVGEKGRKGRILGSKVRATRTVATDYLGGDTCHEYELTVISRSGDSGGDQPQMAQMMNAVPGYLRSSAISAVNI